MERYRTCIRQNVWEFWFIIFDRKEEDKPEFEVDAPISGLNKWIFVNAKRIVDFKQI
jgi:hypothetical protein